MSNLVNLAGLRVLPTDGATLGIGPSGLVAIIQLSNIEPLEVMAIRSGKLEVAVIGSGATGFILLRFSFPLGVRTPLEFELPFHIGLMPPESRYIPERPEGLVHSLLISVQDQRGRGCGGRSVTLEPPVCEAIEQLVVQQREEAAQPSWTRRSHDREVEDFYRRYPDSRAMSKKAFANARARASVH